MKIWSAIALAVLLVAGSAAADGRDHDHDRARRAVESGQILPLKDILARAEAAFPGELIEAELEERHGTMVYEIKMLGSGGRVMKLYYDAATGDLVHARSRERRP